MRCVDVPAMGLGAIVDLARAEASELVVVGPEAPLEAGLADALIEARIAVFGATRAAAAIEWSKAFCHEVAAAAGVRMARAMVCTSRSEADRAVTAIAAAGSGVVVKEDGLAAGKGVTVLEPGADPTALLDDLYARDPAARIVIEERLYGAEASVIAVCDGERAVALPAARDHKRLGDGDTGPNTGGMGAYSPLPDLTDADVDGILADVHRPLLAELARRGTPFRGFLYAGLMLTADGPVLLECNARLGDPETQVMLPRLGGALGPVLLAAARGSLPADIPARLPVLPGRRRRDRAGRRGLPGRAESRRADHRDRGGAAPGRAGLPRRDRGDRRRLDDERRPDPHGRRARRGPGRPPAPSPIAPPMPSRSRVSSAGTTSVAAVAGVLAR